MTLMYHDIVPASDEYWTWSSVRRGDMVHSPGTHAFKARDFACRDDDTKCMVLMHAPLLVVSRFEFIPGEPNKRARTFVVLSRHGLLVILKEFA